MDTDQLSQDMKKQILFLVVFALLGRNTVAIFIKLLKMPTELHWLPPFAAAHRTAALKSWQGRVTAVCRGCPSLGQP
jgi:hypothetical protein